MLLIEGVDGCKCVSLDSYASLRVILTTIIAAGLNDHCIALLFLCTLEETRLARSLASRRSISAHLVGVTCLAWSIWCLPRCAPRLHKPVASSGVVSERASEPLFRSWNDGQRRQCLGLGDAAATFSLAIPSMKTVNKQFR